MVQPNNESDFGVVVHRNGRRQKSKSFVHKVKGAKDDPVHHPLCGITVHAFASVKSFEGHVGGVQKADQIGCKLHSTGGKNQKYDD